MSTRRVVTWAVIWSIAFGFLEGAVVVYLRRMYYPDGLDLPLVPAIDDVLAVEITREVATMLMLVGVAMLSARGMRAFGVFALCFGVWDIVYYVALRLFLGWPESLLDWDILFLIPVTWASPVLAPVLVSIALIGSGVVMIRSRVVVRPLDWAIEVVAGGLILASFFAGADAWAEAGDARSFPWWLFGAGYGLGVGWFARCWRVSGHRESRVRPD